MIGSIPLANLHSTCNYHMMSRVEGEVKCHPPPIYPHEQGSKIGGYGLSHSLAPSFPNYCPYEQEANGRLLEIVFLWYISWNILFLYDQVYKFIFNTMKWGLPFFIIHVRTHTSRVTNLDIGETISRKLSRPRFSCKWYLGSLTFSFWRYFG